MLKLQSQRNELPATLASYYRSFGKKGGGSYSRMRIHTSAMECNSCANSRYIITNFSLANQWLSVGRGLEWGIKCLCLWALREENRTDTTHSVVM